MRATTTSHPAHRTCRYFILPLLFLFACDQADEPDESGSEPTVSAAEDEALPLMRPADAEELDQLPEVAGEPLPIIASVETHLGSHIAFVDEGEGEIGISEQGPWVLVVPELTSRQDATPLEIYLAFSSETPPEALVSNHAVLAERQGRETIEPQEVLLSRFHGHYYSYDLCYYPTNGWTGDWLGTAWGTDVEAASATAFSGCGSGYLWFFGGNDPCYFYPGGGVNTTTYMGVCHGPYYDSKLNNYEAKIQRLVSGSWTTVSTVQMNASFTSGGEKYVYLTYNQTYRYRTKMTDNLTNSDYHRAGAGVAYDPLEI